MIYSSNNNDKSVTNDSPNPNNSGYKTIKVHLKGKSGNSKDNRSRSESPLNKRQTNKHKTKKWVVTEETDREDVQISIPTKPIDPEVRRTDLRNRKIVNCKEVAYPKVNKLI